MADMKGDAEMKGWLFKWTNYLKGYQKRWFVLSNGLLSYYRNQAEMAHTCRGTISLHGAIIHTEGDSCTFVISNGGTQTFHVKASSEVERQRWVTALELAKAKAIRALESDEEDEEPASVAAAQGELRALTAKLEDLQTCVELIAKHGAALQRSVTDLETTAAQSITSNVDDDGQPPNVNSNNSTNSAMNSSLTSAARLKTVNERATLLRITSNAMMNTCHEYLELAQTQVRKWQKMLQHERDQRMRLEEMVEQLARQHSSLEQAAQDLRRPPGAASPSDEDDENEFYDAQGDECGGPQGSDSTDFILKVPLSARRPSSSFATSGGGDELDDEKSKSSLGESTELEAGAIGGSGGGGSSGSEAGSETEVLVIKPSTSSAGQASTRSRTRILSMAPSRQSIRSENHTKSRSPSREESLSHSTENVSSPGRRRRTRVPDKPHYPLSLWNIMKNCIGKELSKIPMPVNFSEPLSMLQRLTEDYEYAEILDRAAECTDPREQLAQVAAFTVSSYASTSNRTGKPFNPLLGETYECDRLDDLGWRSVSEQVSHHPPMVAQHCEGRRWKCWQEFTMASKFRGKYLQVIPLGIAHLVFPETGHHYTWRKVTTTVHNIIVGKLWVDQHGDMDIENHTTGDKCHLKYIPYSYFTREEQRRVKGAVRDSSGQVSWVLTGTWDKAIEIAPVSADGNTYGDYKLAWERRLPPSDSERYYHFTTLACQLNEPETGISPTDSRLRPDQRLMEQGEWDSANAEKLRLEDKQRQARRLRESEAEKAASQGKPYPPYQPVWFKQEKDSVTGNICHIFTGEYWKCKQKQKWPKDCPNIF